MAIAWASGSSKESFSLTFWWADGVMCAEQKENKCCRSLFWGVKQEKSCNPDLAGGLGRSGVLILSRKMGFCAEPASL